MDDTVDNCGNVALETSDYPTDGRDLVEPTRSFCSSPAEPQIDDVWMVDPAGYATVRMIERPIVAFSTLIVPNSIRIVDLVLGCTPTQLRQIGIHLPVLQP